MGGLGIGEQLADIERIRRILGDREIVLIGHSYGAFLAALYAAEWPENVAALVLVAPADLLEFPPPSGGLFAVMRERLPDRERPEFDAWLDRYLDFGGLFERSTAELAAEDALFAKFFEHALGIEPPQATTPVHSQGVWMARAQYFSMGRRHDYRAALATVAAPTLILHGQDDLQPAIGRTSLCRRLAEYAASSHRRQHAFSATRKPRWVSRRRRAISCQSWPVMGARHRPGCDRFGSARPDARVTSNAATVVTNH